VFAEKRCISDVGISDRQPGGLAIGKVLTLAE